MKEYIEVERAMEILAGNYNCASRHSWISLIVDEKVLHIYPRSKFPKAYIKQLKFTGIDIRTATREERKPYLEQEKCLKCRNIEKARKQIELKMDRE